MYQLKVDVDKLNAVKVVGARRGNEGLTLETSVHNHFNGYIIREKFVGVLDTISARLKIVVSC